MKTILKLIKQTRKRIKLNFGLKCFEKEWYLNFNLKSKCLLTAVANDPKLLMPRDGRNFRNGRKTATYERIHLSILNHLME